MLFQSSLTFTMHLIYVVTFFITVLANNNTIAIISTQYESPRAYFDFPIGLCYPDPWIFRPGPLNIPGNPFLNVSDGSSHSIAASIGLHGLNVELELNMFFQSLSFKVQLPVFYLVGPRYNASGDMDFRPFRHSTFPSGKFRGKGPFVASIQNLYIEGSIQLYFTLMMSHVYFRGIEINTLNFATSAVNFGTFELDDGTGTGFEKIDWSIWNQNFKSHFDADWANISIRNATLARITDAINNRWMPLKFTDFYYFLQNPCTNETSI